MKTDPTDLVPVICWCIAFVATAIAIGLAWLRPEPAAVRHPTAARGQGAIRPSTAANARGSYWSRVG